MKFSKRPLLICFALGWCFVAPLAVTVAQAKGPVKVFILAGQSNMEGKALARTLEPVIADAKTRDRFQHLKTDGEWTVRDDVWVTLLDK